MKEYRRPETISVEEIKNACCKSKCFRQAVSLLSIHLEWIGDFAKRVKKECIDISHFNLNEEYKCQHCGNPYQQLSVADFDDVVRIYGHCKICKTGEWLKDGGPVVDMYKAFISGNPMSAEIVGYRNL